MRKAVDVCSSRTTKEATALLAAFRAAPMAYTGCVEAISLMPSFLVGLFSAPLAVGLIAAPVVGFIVTRHGVEKAFDFVVQKGTDYLNRNGMGHSSPDQRFCDAVVSNYLLTIEPNERAEALKDIKGWVPGAFEATLKALNHQLLTGPDEPTEANLPACLHPYLPFFTASREKVRAGADPNLLAQQATGQMMTHAAFVTQWLILLGHSTVELADR